LLDAEAHDDIAAEVRRLIAAEPAHQIADLHVWRIGAASRACIVSLVAPDPHPVAHYRRLLSSIPGLDHVTVEVHQDGGDRDGLAGAAAGASPQ
jgi:Co/Zn/Cd efflux system component